MASTLPRYSAVMQTHLPLPGRRQGKVRDIYDMKMRDGTPALLIVASDRARFGEVFAKIGLIPDGGGTFFLARRIGLARAKELCFTAEIIDATAAERLGIANRIVLAAALETETLALARRLADGPPHALAAAKILLDRGLHLDLETSLAWEALAQGLMMETTDHREGLAAFFEKRPPRFGGA